MLPYIFIGLAALFFIIYFVTKRPVPPAADKSKSNLKTESPPAKINYGRIRIFYGSQTGTAAKISQQLAEEGVEEGFQPQVVDLKDVKIQHFEGINQVSVFMLSNTGEGDPPQNCVRFMKILKGKENFHEVKELDWKKVNFAVFGLGNTQYEHYNVTGIDADSLLQKLGANRIFKLGLGDDNCSLEDDCNAWRKELWPALKKFREANPPSKAAQEHQVPRKQSESHIAEDYISHSDPVYANYKIYLSKSKEEALQLKQDEYDFKTKASLKAEIAKVHNIRQLRQNQNDGSTLQLQVQMPACPDYQTAGNIALYPKNDPALIKQLIDYFGIKQSDLDRKIGLSVLNQEKKHKYNFFPNTLRSLLQQSIDLQGKLAKSVLKKLAKFESKNPNYFAQNAAARTTDQFRRITERTDDGHWYYLLRIVKEHNVKLAFEDFIELSDSMAPRLFTLASFSKTQRNPIVAASIVDNGLVSKYLLMNPTQIRAQLRKSAFTAAMKWKKVIFVAAGTGLAPFRAYIQQKVFYLEQRKQGKQVNVPIITLFFGCKHEHGDFIYKQQILGWRDQGVIDRLHLAFSRDTDKKVYVQHLLETEQAELNELGLCQQTSIYICGSLPMGNTIIQILTKRFGAETVKKMEEGGRIVKQLW